MKNIEKEIKPGIKLHTIKTEKFKTNLIAIFLSMPITRENVTKNALISSILRRGSMNMPTLLDISKTLEEMYGASFDNGIDKIGDNQILKFYIETINDNYIPQNGENMLKTSIEKLIEIVFNPLIKDKKFNEEYVEQEKENLKQIIEGKIDNKARYSLDRCIEEMYKDKPFGLYKYGYIEDMENINEKYGKADIKRANILDVNIDKPFVDLIVTSPPYVTSYEYADLHQLSTLWLEYTDDFRLLREGTIGSLYHSEEFDKNLKRLNNVGQDIVFKMYSIDKRKTRSIAQYYIDMQSTVHKVVEMLNPGGACLFVIGNTEYKGVKIDNAKHLTECLLAEGMVNIEVDRRKISNKILTPYRDTNGKFASVKGSCRKVYSEEFVIFARKCN